MLGKRIQDLPKNLWFLINRPVFSLMLTGTLLAAYSPAGYQATLPAYVSSELPMVNPPGFIVAGLPYTVGLSLGALVAGCVLYKKDWKLIMHVKMVLLIQGIVVVLFLLAMAPTCDVNYVFNAPIYSNTSYGVAETCSSRCDCRDAQFEPVCSKQGEVFPSGCLAGCRRARMDTEQNIMVHDLCLCLPGEILSSDLCNNVCYGATAGYGVIVFAISMCQSFGQVILLIIALRCISQKLRSLALGFAVCMVFLAAYVPGVAVFRAIQQVTCQFKQDDCLGDAICWHYDSSSYRYIYHGCAALFQFASMAFFLATYFAIRAKARAVSQVIRTGQLSSAVYPNKAVSSGAEAMDGSSGIDNMGIDLTAGEQDQSQRDIENGQDTTL